MQLDSSEAYLLEVTEGEHELFGIKYKESKNALIIIGDKHKTQRYIEYAITIRDKEYRLQYSRGTRQILDDIKIQLGLSTNMVYNNKNITVIDVTSTKESESLYNKISNSAWNKIVKGLEKAYNICFEDESDVSDISISQVVDSYIESSKHIKSKVVQHNRNLRKKYITIQNKELSPISNKEMNDLMSDVSYELRTTSAIGIFDRNSHFYFCQLSHDFITRLRILADIKLNMGISYSFKDNNKLTTIILTGIAYEVSSQHGKEPKNIIFVEDIDDKLEYSPEQTKQVRMEVIPEECNALIPMVIVLTHSNKDKGLDSIEDYNIYEDFNTIPLKYRHITTCLLSEIAIKESYIPSVILMDTTRNTMGFEYFQGMLPKYNKGVMRSIKYTAEDFVIDMSTNLLKDID